MLARLIVTSLVLFLTPMISKADTSAANISTGQEIYSILHKNKLLEDYMIDDIGEIVGTLVSAAGRWSGYSINRPYTEGHINIYLIDNARLPEANILEAQGVDLASYNLKNNVMAHEETGILFVDTELLKSLVVAALLFGESDVDTSVAVGAIKARGINAFRQLWDPALNPRLTSAEYSDHWAMMASGALAFILAHEMGHIYLGENENSKRRMPMRFKDKTDKDLHWACLDLVNKRYRNQQLIEQDADDYAVVLLSKVLFPPGVMNRPLLRYELGARWYVVYSLAEQMIETMYATQSQNVLNSVRLILGNEIYQELIAAKPNSEKGSIHVFFPKTHPANIRRASISLAKLDQSRYSLYHNDPSSLSKDIALFEMVLSMECQNLKSRLGK